MLGNLFANAAYLQNGFEEGEIVCGDIVAGTVGAAAGPYHHWGVGHYANYAGTFQFGYGLKKIINAVILKKSGFYCDLKR